MVALSTDYLTKVGDPGTATTLAAPGHLIGGTTITVVSTANYPTTTGCIFAMDTVTLVNGEEVRDAGTYTEWEGVVTGATTIESIVLRYGSDQNYPAGATTRVYIPVASSRENRLIDGLLVSLDQDGTLKAGAVDSPGVLANGVVLSDKLASGSVTAIKLATNLGYAVRSAALNGLTAGDITDLSITVTVPASAVVLVESFVSALNQYAGVNSVEIYIKEGATTLATGSASMAATGHRGSINTSCILTPTTGSHTYKIAGAVTAGTWDLVVPCYIKATIIG